MIAYIATNARPLDHVDPALLDRKAYELIMSWKTTWNIHATNVTADGVVFADISQASKADVFAWLESINAVCVDLQPQDLATFAGRSVETLAAGDILASDPDVQREATRLTPDQLMSFVSDLLHLAMRTAAAVADERESRINALVFRDGDTLDTSAADLMRDRFNAEDEQYLKRLRDAGFDNVPELVNLDPPPVVNNDSQYDEAFGITAPRNVTIDPFRFNQ